MDAVGLGLPLGIALARIGCFLNGCCYGTASNLPWAVGFPAAGKGTFHPTQIYESIAALAIFAILQASRGFRRNYGEAFLGCMGLYGFFRFFIEYYRAENPVLMAGLKLSQIIGLAVVILSVAAWFLIDRSRRFRMMPATESTILQPDKSAQQ
jgi:phosphatidylglycerol:prolipoprotein diacylglycerol transferase